MHSSRSLLASLALLVAPALAHAVPVEYRFDLTVTELSSGSNADPYYSQFHLGQQFNGSFIYDPDAAIQVSPSTPSYYNTFQYSVRIGDAVIGNGSFIDGGFRPRVNVVDLPAADGGDRFGMFDEVPELLDGFFGTDGGYIEQFFLSFTEGAETAVVGSVPAPVDFSLFSGTRWNFWWQPDDSPESMQFDRLLLYGSINNVREVPEPATFGLLAAALVGFGWIRLARRTRSNAASSTR